MYIVWGESALSEEMGCIYTEVKKNKKWKVLMLYLVYRYPLHNYIDTQFYYEIILVHLHVFLLKLYIYIYVCSC